MRYLIKSIFINRANIVKFLFNMYLELRGSEDNLKP